MASLASINIRFSADLRQFSSEMQNSLREIEKFGSRLQSIGTSMSTYITAPLLLAGGAAIHFASDYEESFNKVEASFKGSSQQVKDFAKTTLTSFGIAEGTALDLASTYGDMGTSLGLTTDAAATMSTQLVGLAGDLASFKNISIDVANTALKGIFTGETESLKTLGVVMTEANLQNFAYSQGMKTKIKDMDQASKVNLRHAYIMSVTKNAQGDFAKTSDGAANQMRIFTESMKQLAQQFGSIILPLFTGVISKLNSMVSSFGTLSEGVKKTIVVVAAITAAIGPLLLVVGTVVAAIPTLVAGFAALSSIVTIASGAFTALSAAMLANPITALVLVVTAAAAAYVLMGDSSKKAVVGVVELSNAQKLTKKITDEATASIVDQKSKLELLLLTAKNENESKSARLKAIQAINKISPEYLGNLTLENINTDKARIAVEKYNTALLSGATARAASRLLEENQADKIKAGFEREKALADYNEKRNNAISKGWEAEKAFYEENNRLLQFANEALDRKNAKYDSEAKLLTEIYEKNKKNLGLVKDQSPVVSLPDKEAKKPKKNKNLSDLNVPLKQGLSSDSIAAFDAEIAKLRQFRDEVATTAVQVKNANDAIKRVEFGKALNFDPTSLITISGGFDKLVTDMQAKAGGLKAVADSMKTIMYDLSTTISDAVTQLANNAIVGFGEAIGGVINGTQNLESVFSSMLGVVYSFMKDLGKQLIAVGIARIAFDKLKFSGIGAVAAGIALVALSTAVSSKFNNAPKFEDGGVVGGSSFYGDKILARVNSGELILNKQQQASLNGQLNVPGNTSVFIPDVRLKGNDLWVSFKRTEELKNRLT